MWQDITIFIANIVFVYALVPQVWKGFKGKKPFIAFQTGILNTLGLCAVMIAFFSLGLLFSGIITTFTTLLWLILFIQSIVYK